MSIWTLVDHIRQTPTPEEAKAYQLKMEATALREAIASKDLNSISATMDTLKASGTNIGELIKSDASMLRTIGSRIVRSQTPFEAGALLDMLAKQDRAILTASNSGGKTLTTEIAAFAKHYKLPKQQKTALESVLADYGIYLPVEKGFLRL